MTENQDAGLARGASLSLPTTSRRSLVTAAAWSTPVLLTSAALPALAASPVTTLAFNVFPSDFQSGTVSSGGVLYASRGGAAASGESVTIALSSGLRWAGGTNVTSARSLLTDAKGTIKFTGNNGLTATSYGTYAVTATWTPAGGDTLTANATVVCSTYAFKWVPDVGDFKQMNIAHNAKQTIVAQATLNGKPVTTGIVTVNRMGVSTVMDGKTSEFTKSLGSDGKVSIVIQGPDQNAPVGTSWGVTLRWSLLDKELVGSGNFT